MAEAFDYTSPGNEKPELPPFTKSAYRQLLLVLMICVVITIFADLWERRLSPYGSADSLLTDLGILLVSVGASLVIGVTWLWRVFRFRESWNTRMKWLAWTIPPLFAFALICVWNYYELSFQIAFWLCRGSLERAATEVKGDPSKGKVHRTVGLFPIKQMDPVDGGVAVSVDGAQGIDATFRLLWTDKPPSLEPFHTKEDLGHHWYFQSDY